MGKCAVTYREIRFIISDTGTTAYVYMDATGDCPIMLHGWHKKAFNVSTTVLDVIQSWNAGEEDPLLWETCPVPTSNY